MPLPETLLYCFIGPHPCVLSFGCGSEFFLPRLLPGNPVAYLTGFSEQDMTPAQVAFYEDALHLNKPLAMQFGYYLRSLLDGTLGYSYKKDAAVSALIGEKIGYTLQITVPAVLLSAGIGLFWGLRCGYKRIRLPIAFPQQR